MKYNATDKKILEKPNSKLALFRFTNLKGKQHYRIAATGFYDAEDRFNRPEYKDYTEIKVMTSAYGPSKEVLNLKYSLQESFPNIQRGDINNIINVFSKHSTRWYKQRHRF